MRFLCVIIYVRVYVGSLTSGHGGTAHNRPRFNSAGARGLARVAE